MTCGFSEKKLPGLDHQRTWVLPVESGSKLLLLLGPRFSYLENGANSSLSSFTIDIRHYISRKTRKAWIVPP